jgi:hypothetical protein
MAEKKKTIWPCKRKALQALKMANISFLELSIPAVVKKQINLNNKGRDGK